jgi:hypothetical protein
MKGLKNTIAVFLGIIGAWMVVTGLTIALQTMGRVSGTEFSMLITANQQLALAILWLGIFGLWSIIPDGTSDE